jgi:hypothetical protein
MEPDEIRKIPNMEYRDYNVYSNCNGKLRNYRIIDTYLNESHTYASLELL